MIANDATMQAAADYLAKHDPMLAPIIAVVGPCTIRPHRNYYQALVTEIIGQQLSVKAAASILKKFVALYGSDHVPAADQILTKDVEELRSAGLSYAKAAYVRDLAQHVVDGKVQFDHLDSLSNDEISKELTAVKGIGQWTVHMFLMFCMGRLDVLPVGDLGIRNGIQKLYKLDHLPTAADIETIAAKHHWHPYESVASCYIWRSLDNKPIE